MPSKNGNHDNGKSSPNGWTLDTLEEYLSGKVKAVEKYFYDLSNEREARNSERFSSSKEAVTSALAAAEKAIAAAMTASEKAILKSESSADKRAEASNEIRAAMIDQQKNFADKVQTDFRFGSTDSKLEEFKTTINRRLDDLGLTVASSNSRVAGKGEGIVSVGNIIIGIIAFLAMSASIISVTIAIRSSLG